ncbi:SH3 domain-containing protein [uncultured Stenotrophomonas sp.]|uniref:SH3 domain-containing protein n=1 Tax=uncultured Stenotrophomonas sp. TaxID=165438 RepID=UPI0025DC35E7|nr:SH3 domain-containing protein [uncultured Stenotrophomonas sp.]HDS1579382.1 peptide-binding protein [Stenotrophomonas maltophilia]
MRARLLGAYRSQYPNPLRFRAGQIVEVGVRDEEWPAFAWVRTNDGRAGWAPVAWLQLLDDGRAEALCDYDARELDVESGEMVKLHHEHGGWWWSERANGATGWLPARELELLEENCK